MTHSTVPVLLLIGPAGVGKTSTAYAVSDILKTQDIPHAIVDLDRLRDVFPAPKNDQYSEIVGQKNLASIWRNYQSVGAKCLIVATIVDRHETIDDFHASIPGASLFIARLHAPLETVHDRLRGRESAKTIDWYLNRAAVLTDLHATTDFGDTIFDTHNKDITETAEEIVQNWDDLKSLNLKA